MVLPIQQYRKQDWGYFTQKGNKLYMCVFNRPINNLLKIEIPKGGIIPMKAYFLENNQETEIQNAGKNKRNSSLYHVAVPASYKTDRPFVIVLETAWRIRKRKVNISRLKI